MSIKWYLQQLYSDKGSSNAITTIVINKGDVKFHLKFCENKDVMCVCVSRRWIILAKDWILGKLVSEMQTTLF